MVEQNFRFAAPLADRFCVMEHGRVVQEFTPGRAAGADGAAARVPGRLTHVFPEDLRDRTPSNRSLYPFSPEISMKLEETRRRLRPRRHRHARRHAAQAQISGDVIKIGVITDMSGLYSDIDGHGRRRGDPDGDRRLRRHGRRQEDRGRSSADHQNKADVAAQGARVVRHPGRRHADRRHQLRRRRWRWPRSPRRRRSSSSSVGAATSALTNEDCTPYTVHYAYDTLALANGTGSAVVKQGGKTWFFLTADYAFGTSLENDTADGGQGHRRHGARLGAPPAVRVRLLVVPAAGAVVQGADPRAWPTPAATRSTRSRRPTSSASPRR